MYTEYVIFQIYLYRKQVLKGERTEQLIFQ